MELKDDDLEFHSWPPEPRGGQHTGKYHFGILIIHRPTGLSCVSVSERSQLANKNKALYNLREMYEFLCGYGYFGV